jgi:hypothetical protein
MVTFLLETHANFTFFSSAIFRIINLGVSDFNYGTYLKTLEEPMAWFLTKRNICIFQKSERNSLMPQGTLVQTATVCSWAPPWLPSPRQDLRGHRLLLPPPPIRPTVGPHWLC